MFHKILVAIDGSPAGEKALAAAVDLAARYQADVIALSVAELPQVASVADQVDETSRRVEEQLRRIGEAAAHQAGGQGVALRSVVARGHPADVIVAFAEREEVDLLVLGQHGHSRITRFFLGSTSDRVSEHSPCTVMIVK